MKIEIIILPLRLILTTPVRYLKPIAVSIKITTPMKPAIPITATVLPERLPIVVSACMDERD